MNAANSESILPYFGNLSMQLGWARERMYLLYFLAAVHFEAHNVIMRFFIKASYVTEELTARHHPLTFGEQGTISLQ